MEADYRGESDHGTLMRAEEIKQDADRMKGVRRHHRKQKKALTQVSRSMLATGRK